MLRSARGIAIEAKWVGLLLGGCFAATPAPAQLGGYENQGVTRSPSAPRC